MGHDHEDRLSQLPETIINQILSYLPEKQVPQIYLLSKTFLQFMATRSTLYLRLTDDVKIRKKIDAILERYNQERLAITKFKLIVMTTLEDKNIIASTYRWLDIVINNMHLQEIELLIATSKNNNYNVPIGIFSLKNLRSLWITGINKSVSLSCDACQFDKQISGLRSLRTMRFHDLKIVSWLLKKLISNCVNIENLFLNRLDSPGLEKIEVHELEKINKLHIRFCEGLKDIDIENAPNLESVKVVYYSNTTRPNIRILGAEKLTDVTIDEINNIFHVAPLIW
ncbi:hypothetical protein LIER_14188 [Lithospermum erythrorhizon]|uniref:F-box domain-containing protein n=1 Tax=Lithospermum erythrorhizon TaxID=34254 RepID=A0AAV3Q2U5_LITER